MLKTVGNPSTRYGDQSIIDGNLVIGTAGKGIDFSANSSAAGMTSELLDDYEEGTWTPANTNAISINGTATYTKIGRLVVCRFDFTAGASNTTGDMTGLPFTISGYSSGVVGFHNEATAAVWTIIATSGTAFTFRIGGTQQQVTAGRRCAGVLLFETTA